MNKHKCHLEMKGNHSDGQSVRLSGCGSGLKHQPVREHAVSRRTLTVKKSPKILRTVSLGTVSVCANIFPL